MSRMAGPSTRSFSVLPEGYKLLSARCSDEASLRDADSQLAAVRLVQQAAPSALGRRRRLHVAVVVIPGHRLFGGRFSTLLGRLLELVRADRKHVGVVRRELERVGAVDRVGRAERRRWVGSSSRRATRSAARSRRPSTRKASPRRTLHAAWSCGGARRKGCRRSWPSTSSCRTKTGRSCGRRVRPPVDHPSRASAAAAAPSRATHPGACPGLAALGELPAGRRADARCAFSVRQEGSRPLGTSRHSPPPPALAPAGRDLEDPRPSTAQPDRPAVGLPCPRHLLPGARHPPNARHAAQGGLRQPPVPRVARG